MSDADHERLRKLVATLGNEDAALVQRLLDEREKSLNLLLLGEAAGGLVHAVNNHLNSMILQAACIHLQVGESVREATSSIRQEGALAAARLRPIQAIKPWSKEEEIDLAALLRENQVSSARVVEPGPSRTILASRFGVERLLSLLVQVGQDLGVECPELRIGPGARVALLIPGLEQEIPSPASAEGQLRQEALTWLARQVKARVVVEPGVLALVWEV